MPLAPPRPCHTCGRIHCDQHGVPSGRMRWDTDRRPEVTRLAGRANQQRRRRVLARDPFCYVCAASGRTTIATIADHVQPLAESGMDDMRNLSGVGMAGICAECHTAKTQQEARRGRRR